MRSNPSERLVIYMMKKLSLLLIALGLTGCAGFVQTSSTTFHGSEHINRGSIAVLPIDKTQEGSLEFRSVSEHLTKKLTQVGYTSTTSSEKPMFAAFITYGIDNGTTSVSSVPLFGQTGGGTSYTTGSVSSYGRTSNFSGTTTTMPTYGMVGAMPVSSTEYKRRVNIDIWKNESSPTKVYEMRGLSSGSCGNINAILSHIIDGMFENFPGENGKAKRVNVDWNAKC
jgi:hypothetical protein